MDKKIGLFFGTDTGNTETVANTIKDKIHKIVGKDIVEVFEIYKKEPQDIEKYQHLLIGMPTWYDGELQGDWETFLPKWEKIENGGHLHAAN